LAAIAASASDWSPCFWKYCWAIRPKTPANLEILLGDPAEDPGEAAFDLAFLLQVGGLEQHPADLRPRDAGHLFHADHQDEAGFFRLDGLQPLVDRRRARGAGVLDVGRRLEAQAIVELQHQGSGKALRRKALVEGAEQDLVDLPGADPGVVQRLGRHLADEGFRVLAFVLAEGRVAPADDAGGHVGLSILVGVRDNSNPTARGTDGICCDAALARRIRGRLRDGAKHGPKRDVPLSGVDPSSDRCPRDGRS
jgi:hypothetical protein